MTLSQKYGRWAVIAGGSEGIGAAFADELAARGLNLLLFARRSAPLEELAASIRAVYPAIEVRVRSVDLAKSDAVEHVKQASADVEVGVFLYNAGAETNYGYFLDHEWEWLEERYQRNLIVKSALLHHFGRQMRARKRGAIILMGSFAGFFGLPGFALYAASKAFTHFLTEGLWYELKQDNVHMLCTVVGPTETPAMVKAYGPMEGPKTDPAFIVNGTLERLEQGPIWIADNIVDQVKALSALPPAERATVTAQMAAKLGEKVKAMKVVAGPQES
jgi:short-subunit dehydrogenase